jgi:hypothetical protein
MNNLTPEGTDRLVDVFDAVLADRNASRPPAADSLQGLSPDLAAEGEDLLRILGKLNSAVEVGRGPPPERPATAEYVPAGPGLPATLGRYEILAPLGAGGMGTVYKARDPRLGRTVAIKVPRLDPSHPDHAKRVKRFLREARLAAVVRHPNVCPIHDWGKQDGTPFVVLAYVDGPSLAQHLERHGPYADPAGAVAVVSQVATALAAIHARGFVHRDLKPANILLEGLAPTPLLTDFGLARPVIDTAHLTVEGVIAGTPPYLAPEQFAGYRDSLSPAADLYSLGVVLYECLTGRVPFTGNLSALSDRVVNEPPPPLTQFRPDLDPGLEAIVQKLLAKRPGERFADAGAVVEALRPWTGTPPIQVENRRPPRPFPRLPWGWLGGVAAVLLVAVGLLVWTAHRQGLPELAGSVTVRVWSPQGQEGKRGVAVGEEGALPVRCGEGVRLEVEVSQPAFVYLFMVAGDDGEVQPLYPWDRTRGETLDTPMPRQTPLAKLVVPPPGRRSFGFPVGAGDGLDTILLLARTEEMPGDTNWRSLFGELSPTKVLNRREAAWLDLKRGAVQEQGFHRRERGGVQPGLAIEVDAPLADLSLRLAKYFEVIKAVRYAHVDK